MSHKLYR